MVAAHADAPAAAAEGDVGTAIAAVSAPAVEQGAISPARLTYGLRRRLASVPRRCCIVSLSWNAALWPFHHPLDYIGSAGGGGGIGAGPGIAVGAALALRGSGRLPVAVCGDGDFLMGATRSGRPCTTTFRCFMVVANNRSFFNDELHQERVARMRNRPVENRWIGQRIADPEIDISRLAQAQGAQGFGPSTEEADLAATFRTADRGGGRRCRCRGRCAGGARLRTRGGRGVVPGMIVLLVCAVSRSGRPAVARRASGAGMARGDFLAVTPGLRQALIYTPSRTSDPYLDDGRAASACHAALFRRHRVAGGGGLRRRYLHGLAAQGALASLRDAGGTQQAMLVRRFGVPDPTFRMPPGEHPCTYLVAYEGEADDLNAWHRPLHRRPSADHGALSGYPAGRDLHMHRLVRIGALAPRSSTCSATRWCSTVRRR